MNGKEDDVSDWLDGKYFMIKTLRHAIPVVELRWVFFSQQKRQQAQAAHSGLTGCPSINENFFWRKTQPNPTKKRSSPSQRRQVSSILTHTRHTSFDRHNHTRLVTTSGINLSLYWLAWKRTIPIFIKHCKCLSKFFDFIFSIINFSWHLCCC